MGKNKFLAKNRRGPKISGPIPTARKRKVSAQSIERLKEMQEVSTKLADSHHIKAHQKGFRQVSQLKKMIQKRETQILKSEGTFVAKQPLTIDHRRVKDATIEHHKIAEEELLHAETNDELKTYFTLNQNPKVALTIEQYKWSHQHKRSVAMKDDLISIFGGVFEYVERGDYKKKCIREFCCELYQQGYTSVFMIQETIRGPTHCLMIALPYGPSAYYRLYEYDLRKDLKGAGKPTFAPPEIIMTNFNTRLGRRVGRLIQQNLSQKEAIQARQVVTFHNQRDNIFMRAYRYVFTEKQDADLTNDKIEDKVDIRMQELGPRLSFKLRWIQHGVYDPEYEEYEFYQNANIESANRTLFFL
ncbi:Brix domain-containing protein [Spironucleus salmonicida]|uniref:Brix domain-containing protein n=1 Tax=Spironucleus salmonicida TaxID=348837 RepID=V6LQV2_9EUKA|nr:Brix domain-containing protein [Spironucleus salmonicida]|eukprot:EST46628.1 Brix domain-containing protein [Spironucleus salmonicida]